MDGCYLTGRLLFPPQTDYTIAKAKTKTRGKRRSSSCPTPSISAAASRSSPAARKASAAPSSNASSIPARGCDLGSRPATGAKRPRRNLASRGRVEAVAVDVTDYADVERAREETLKAFGRIDILVNNAGIAGPNMKTWDYPLEAWQQVLAVNLDGPFHCCRARGARHDRAELRPHRQHRVDRRQGRQPERAGLFGLESRRHRADKIARQGTRGSHDISVNCLTPAAARTAIFDQMTQEHIDFMLSKIPRGRFVTVDEIAGAGGVLRLGRMFVHDRRGVRHFRRPGHLLTDPAHQRRQRLIGIALMCGAVALFCLPRRDGEISQSLHVDTLQVVWARYAGAFVLALFLSNPVSRPALMVTHAAVAADRPLVAAARLDAVEFLRAALAATRRDHVDPVLDAVPGGGAVGPDAGRMGRLAALVRDLRRLCRRAAGDAAGLRRHSSGGAALGRHRCSATAFYIDRDAAAGAHATPARPRCSIPIWSARWR